MNTQLADLPTGLLVALAILVVVQLALDVVALVDLYRRPVDRVALGNKWVWVAIILFVNTIGAIIYLAAGRRPAPAGEVPPPTAPSAARSESIADALYGRRADTGGPDAAGPDAAGPR